MAPTRPDEDEDDPTSDEPDWQATLARARAQFKEDLGDRTVDWVEIIHEMRDERDIEILSNIYGEERAIEMVRGASSASDDDDSLIPHPWTTLRSW